MKASELTLDELKGRRVRALRDFSGIPRGTEGVVDSVYGIGRMKRGIFVTWIVGGGNVRTAVSGHGRSGRDDFGRDVGDFDETVYLAVVGNGDGEPVASCPDCGHPFDEAGCDGDFMDRTRGPT